MKEKKVRSPRLKKVLVDEIEVVSGDKGKLSFDIDVHRSGVIRVYFEYDDDVTLFDVQDFMFNH